MNFSNATWAAAISHLVEVNAQQSGLWYRKFGFTKIQHMNIAESGTQADWLENDSLSILVFRGTDEAKDILYDINITARDIPGVGKFHRGFADAFTSIWPKLLPLVVHAQKKPLLVFGHSLGGALAQVYVAHHLALAKDDPQLLPDLRGLITLAAPGPLHKDTKTKLAALFDANGLAYFQFVNPYDITPKAVPNFVNLGKEFKLTENSKFFLPGDAHNIKHYFDALNNLAVLNPNQGCDGGLYQGPQL